MQEAKFKIKKEDGTTVDCEVLLTFEGENGKHYMVYTDNTNDEEGNVKVYAATYTPGLETQTMLPIETEEEWEVIETILQVASETVEEEDEQ